MVPGMLDTPFSRRDFLASSAVLAAAHELPAQVHDPAVAAAPARPEPRAAGGPLRILARTAFEPDELRTIEGAAPNVAVTLARTPAEIREHLPHAEVVYGTLSADDLPLAARVKWLQASSAGVESLAPELVASGIVITNMARVFAPAISETAMGLLLCLTRGITTYYMPQFARRQMKPVGTVKSADHVELAGKTMGIVGLGGIGSAVARRAHHGFDMRIVATDARPLPRPEYVAELRDPSWFVAMVPQVDVLVAAAPQTPLTVRMFDEPVFRAMKRTAYFLALSRGPSVRRRGARARAERRLDCRCGTGRVPAGAPAGRASDLRLPQRRHDGAHVRLEPGSPGAAGGVVRRERPALCDRRSTAERRRQEGRILSGRSRSTRTQLV